MKTSIIISFLALLLTSCSMTDREIESRVWKDGGPDYISLNSNNWTIENDTLFFNDTAKATLIEASWKSFGYTTQLIIQSIETGELGHYYDMGPKSFDKLTAVERRIAKEYFFIPM